MITRIPFNQLGFDFLHVESSDPSCTLLNQLPERGLAVIGSRSPQLRSFHILNQTIHDLRHSNLVIVSGFARGVDSKAHESALDHGLKTIAIMGCGLNVDYPKENRQLRRKIVESGGMVISPFHSEAPALAHHFLQRNQLIAYFSKAVWVVEAAAISGTLNTANHASQLNRDLYATPAFPGDSLFRGNELLLSQIDPHKYPIAEPLYGAHSLFKTWSKLNAPLTNRSDLKKNSRLLRWIDDLKHREGSCQFHTLLRLSSEKGMNVKEFYLEYETCLKSGKIIEGPLGTIETR